MTRNGKSQLGGKINRGLFAKARPAAITRKITQPKRQIGNGMENKPR